MTAPLNPTILVLEDGTPEGTAAVAAAVAASTRVVVLSVGEAQPHDRIVETVPVDEESKQIGEAMAAAADRGISWVAVPRSLAAPADLLSDALVAAGKHAGAVPGFAVCLAPAGMGPVNRVLCVFDQTDGPGSGMAGHAAIEAAGAWGAQVDFLVLGAPGEPAVDPREPGRESDGLREHELLAGALARAAEEGLEPTWIIVDSPEDRVAEVIERLSDYDVVVEAIGDVRLGGRLRRPNAINDALAQGGEIPLALLEQTEIPLIVVMDAVTLGLVAPMAAKAGIGAAAAVVLVAGAGAVGSSDGAADKPIAVSAGSAAELQDRLDEVLAGEEEDEENRRAERASRSAKRSNPAASVKVVKPPTAKQVKEQRQKAAAAVKKVADTKKTAAAVAKQAEAAEQAVDAALVKAAAANEVLKSAEATAAEAESKADDLHFESEGIIAAILPGGPTEQEVALADVEAARAGEALKEVALDADAALKEAEAATAHAEKMSEQAGAAAMAATDAASISTKEVGVLTALEKSLAGSKASPVAEGSFRLTMRFGQPGPYWVSGIHNGLDFAAPTGTPVLAAGSGTVVETSRGGPYGNRVVVQHAGGVKTTYNHLSKITVKEGTKVVTGEEVGKLGNTGNSTGPHLHFEVDKGGKFIDPSVWIWGKRR